MKAQLRDQGCPRIGFYSNTFNFVFDIFKKKNNQELGLILGLMWWCFWGTFASLDVITLEPNSFDKLIVIMGNEGFELQMSSLGTPRSANQLSYPPVKLFFQTKFFNPIWSSFESV